MAKWTTGNGSAELHIYENVDLDDPESGELRAIATGPKTAKRIVDALNGVPEPKPLADAVGAVEGSGSAADAQFKCRSCGWECGLDDMIRGTAGDYCPKCNAKDTFDRMAVSPAGMPADSVESAADTARLDWLEEIGFSTNTPTLDSMTVKCIWLAMEQSWGWVVPCQSSFDNVRKAIDTAMAGATASKQPAAETGSTPKEKSEQPTSVGECGK